MDPSASSRPADMIPILPASSSASSIECVQTTRAEPASRSSARYAQARRVESGSRALVGSSASTRPGWCSVARISATFWRMPLE